MNPRQAGYAIGLMSGTSVDGIDASLVWFDERKDSIFPALRVEKSLYVPFTQAQREAIFPLFDEHVSNSYVLQLDRALGEWFGNAVVALLHEAQVKADEVSVVGSHGQTVLHRPDLCMTHQVGDPAVIAQISGCPIVSNFRRQDVVLGGQGAPLVPYFDYGYFRSDRTSRVLLNIGGIANMTYLPKGQDLDVVRAFDTGPGNMVIDAFVRILTAGECLYDKGGQMAASGQIHADVVAQWMEADPYLKMPPPKSTGRELYGDLFVAQRLRETEDWPVDDQVATITYYVAKTIAMAIQSELAGEPFELITGGGGRHNRQLIDWIVDMTKPVAVRETEEFGVPCDMKEAIAFALFAWQFIQNRPTNVPSATGASQFTPLGQFTPSPDVRRGIRCVSIRHA